MRVDIKEPGNDDKAVMIWRVSLLAVLALWIAIPDAAAIRSLESVPASDGGVLTAGVRQQISLTCSHDNDVTVTTFWKIGAPIDCTTVTVHITAANGVSDCGPFSFVNVSPGNTAPFTSTAIATANTSMTGAVVQCLDGAGASAVQVGSNITLCVYGPVSGVSCSNNLEISWNTVIDSPACANQVEYMVTITNISGVVTTRNVSDNQIDVSDVFQRGESYNVSVCSKAVGGSCSAEPVTILCEISLTPPTTTSTTPATRTSPITLITSPQGTSVAAIVVPVILVVAIIVSIPVIIFIVYCFCRPGRTIRDQKALTYAGEEEHKAKMAPVPGSNKPNSARADATEMPTYLDPATIQHEQAASGDLYALTDNLEKRSKKEKSEEVLAGMYSVPDKSKKNQLTYAEIEMSGGSGMPVNQGPQTEYSTVIN